MDDAPPRGWEPLYAAVMTEHYQGTGPQPSFTPLPVPEPEPVPEPVMPDGDTGTRLLDFLADFAVDAAEGARRRAVRPCGDCATAGFCGNCAAAYVRIAVYDFLGELLEAAPDDRAAIRLLLAEEWRTATAVLGHEGGDL
jgi:hypothetical protein